MSGALDTIENTAWCLCMVTIVVIIICVFVSMLVQTSGDNGGLISKSIYIGYIAFFVFLTVYVVDRTIRAKVDASKVEDEKAGTANMSY